MKWNLQVHPFGNVCSSSSPLLILVVLLLFQNYLACERMSVVILSNVNYRTSMRYASSVKVRKASDYLQTESFFFLSSAVVYRTVNV